MEKNQEELEFLVFEEITNQTVKGHSGSTPEGTAPPRDPAQPQPSRPGRAPALTTGGRGWRDSQLRLGGLSGPQEGRKKHSL